MHGGTMHNHVTYRLAQTFRDNGVSCVRFNFRGVGRSSGTHDQGAGEIEDACGKTGPLDEAERVLCEEAERLLEGSADGADAVPGR